MNKTRKTTADFSDVIDDSIRMALSHVRGLGLYETAKIRAFRKMDVTQQAVVQKLIDQPCLTSEAPGMEPSDSRDTATSMALVPVDEPGPTSSASISGEADMDADAIFRRILQPKDSDGSQNSYGSVAFARRGEAAVLSGLSARLAAG